MTADPLRAAADELRLGGDDARAVGAAARRGGIPVERLLEALLAHGLTSEASWAATGYVEQTLVAQAETVAQMAHDLRSPLTAMIGMIQTLQRGIVDPEMTDEFLRRLERSCLRLEGMISEVVMLAALDAGTLRARREEIDLGSLLSAVAERAGRPVAVETVEPLPPLRGDRDLITKIVERLVDNAVRHSVSPPVLRAHPSERVVLVAVSDDGPGIGAEHHARLFERSFQVPGDRRRGRRGLGLAVACEVATVIRARLRVDSTPGEGSTFLLELPVDR